MIPIRNIMKIIHIHPVLLIFMVLALLTGTFVQLFIMLSIVLIHEMGHFMAAKLLKWRVNRIVLWVFGGVMESDEYSNGKIRHDIIVTLAGPCQHLVIYVVLFFASNMSLLPSSLIELAYFYNGIILLFNLLPIYPLDGGKLLFSVLSLFVPFRYAHRYTIFFSIVACLLIICLHIFLLPFTLSAFLLIIFLLYENIREWKNQYYIFIRFLLNRMDNHPYKNKRQQLIVESKQSLISIFSSFRRNKYHCLVLRRESQRYKMSEDMLLNLYFKHYKYNESIGELMK